MPSEPRALELRVQRADQLLDAHTHLSTNSRISAELGEWLDEASRRSPELRALRVHLPRGERAACGDLAREIAAHFEAKAALTDQQRRETRVRGFASARIGLSFLIVVLAAAELIDVLEGRIPEILSEGLSILGWVALWRPAEELLYEWYPHTKDLARYRALAKLTVELRETESGVELRETESGVELRETQSGVELRETQSGVRETES